MSHNFYNLTIDRNTLINTKEIKEVVMKVKNNTDLIFSKPDKGTGIVLMDKVQYLNKMQDIISDSSKFKLLGLTCKLSYIQKTEKKIIDLLKEWVKNNEITQNILDLVNI